MTLKPVFRMMKLKTNLIVVLIIYLIVAHCYGQKYHFHEEKEGVLLSYGNQNIFYYQKLTKSIDGNYPRANYIHPLYGLNGEVLTEDFPEDHLHHRGIFWAWHQLYIKNKKIGDPWACEGIEWKVNQVDFKVFPDSAQLKTSVSWTGLLPDNQNLDPTELIREETIITCKNKTEDHLEINFDIRISAIHEGTMLGGSDDIKGYGGFSVRVKLPDDLTFYSTEGIVTPQETAIQAGGWIDIHGTFNPGEDNQTALTIMCNPKKPVPFHGWILRDEASMQNAAFPGRKPVNILKGKTLSIRYKILLHRNDMPKNSIKNIYHQFIQD